MADTPITKLRNLMTPVTNHVALLQRLKKLDSSSEEYFKTKRILEDEETEAILFSVMTEIKQILREIPDDACMDRSKKVYSEEECQEMVVNYSKFVTNCMAGKTESMSVGTWFKYNKK